jgi:hypothetical protein
MSKAGEPFSSELCKRLLAEEYTKLRNAGNRNVHDRSKNTTRAIALEIVENLGPGRCQTAVVHRPAQHQPREARPDEGQTAIRLLAEAFLSQMTPPLLAPLIY